MKEWLGFNGGIWQNEINVFDFIVNNYTEYTGNSDFLAGPSLKTKKVWDKCLSLINEEGKKGVLDIDVNHVSGINNFNAGYIDQENEVIVGLQTDEPLKRMINPFGGIRMVEKSLAAYNYNLNPGIDYYFRQFRKTHNDGVFDAYTPEIRTARSVGLLTGLPDAYGRGRIIGDYRRVALYGIDYLIEAKKNDLLSISGRMSNEIIQLREEVSEQIKALEKIKLMAGKYGFDISKPASNAKEAIQWTYFGYLAAIKENNGAAMSLGRTSTFLDIYIERDLKNGLITEDEAQELIDQFIIKLRIARHLRTPEYDELFSGDPTWVTESIGGMLSDGKTSLITKNSYRYLHTLINLGSAPEPNLTILWSENLPIEFKKYAASISIKTDSLQYENDDLMRPIYGSDYAIACCVSAMKVGKQMQFFGARCNLAKSLLLAINCGYDEKRNIKVIDNISKVSDELNYDEVVNNYKLVLSKVAAIYTDAMNIIHYMHDKYAYEAGQMALHDTNVERLMAFGVAGLSVAVDSLSAIKYANVRAIRDENNIAVDFEINGDYPQYGNDDDRVDNIAKELLDYFYKELCKYKLYRDAKHTLSVLTITSNVVYGEKTGSTPDGRHDGEPFAPGANPMHGRDKSGALASLNSVAKLDYVNCCRDGISNTFSITPSTLGNSENEQIANLVDILDGYFKQHAHHLNVNVLTREMLIDAMNNPEKYPTLTIRVSGYAVRFNRLTKKQQLEVISRTFHEKL